MWFKYLYSNRWAVVLLVASICFSSCAERETGKENITERIQYDVDIYNNDRQSDWWKNNIEGMQREKLVKSIVDKAFSGEYLLCDAFSYDPVSALEVKGIFNRIDTVLVQNAEPPYGYSEKIVEETLEFNEITRLRFLEEWKYSDDQIIEKKVLGICPMLESYDEQGEFRGYQPMFWIFFDKKNPLK